MNESKDDTRKRSKRNDDDDHRREKKSKRARSRSGSPVKMREKESRGKRKHSRSKSPEKRVKDESDRNATSKESEMKREAPERKKKETDMLNTRTGGAYIPPARLRMMQAQITDKSSMAYQRLAWEALKKSVHGHINKINVGNIGIIIKELLKENIVRGRGLLCRSVIQAQAASPTFTNVYAALVAAVNSRFPNIGELLLKRLVIQFKRGFKRNDKPICISSASFIAHLVNQRVAHEILALELLTLLVETPTDDSVEVAIAFLKECGQKLTEVSSKGVNAIFEMLRNILHEGQLDKRVQYMIEVMFQVWKDGFKDHPAVVEELELVPEEEQFTHLLMLDDATDSQDILNVFKFDEKYEENEQKYKTLCKEILGSDAESEEGSGESGSEESDDEDEEEETPAGEQKMTIIDNTETNLVALRRTIYLTINSSLDFEECAHKLMKMQLKPGQEVELCHMFLDCCAEQRTYEKFYGLLAQRFCNINRIYIQPFEEIFRESYATAHRLDTNRLRNVSKFFAHLLFTDSIGWEVLECVKLNEEDTTSSSRIYIKILFQELAEYMGLKKLNDRLKDPTLQEAFYGVFPRDNPKNTRFSINFFTSIGLGGLTDELREHLKQMPKNVPPPVTEIQVESGSDSSSSSSSDSSSSDSSDSEEEGSKNKSKKKKKTKKGEEEKDPKTPEDEEPPKNNERWGHDGFYDTYGKDARRFQHTDTRADKDIFVRPRDKRDDRTNRDDFRNRERNTRREDDTRSRKQDNREDDRSKKDAGDVDDNRYRRENFEDRSRRGDERARREDDRSKEYDNRSRKDDERSRKDNERSRNDDERSRNDDEISRKRDERSRNDVERSRKGDERSTKDDERSRNNDERSRNYDERSRKGDERSRNDVERSRKGDERSTKDDERSRNNDERSRNDDERSRKGDERSRNDDERSRKGDERSTKDDERSRNNDERSRNDDERSRKGDERSRNDDERSRKGDERSRKDDEKPRKDLERSRKDDDRSRRDDYRSRKEDRSRRDDDDERANKSEKSRKGKSHGSERSKRDSDDGTRYDKENKSKKDRNRDKSRREDSDSSGDDRRRRDKKRQEDDDGWDIRGSSIRREVPVGRYWES